MSDNSQIPNGWRRVRLEDVAEVVGGSTPSRTDARFWEGDVPWVVPSELTALKGRYLAASKESITDEGMRSAGLRLIPAGSILLTSRATVGVTAINGVPIATNQGFQNLIVKNGADPLWLYYSVSQQRPELERRASGSTFLEVSRDSVRSLPILLPPLPEQRAIAAVLDSIDDAIEGAEAVIAATEGLRDALLHDLLTRGLPGQHTEFRDIPDLGTIPADWEVVRLGDVAEVRNGTTPSRRKPEYWGNEGIPFVKTGQVNDVYIVEPEEFITPSAIQNAGPVIVPKGSVLIAMIGQGKTRGMTAKLGFRAAINQNFAAVYEPRSGFDLDYFFAWASQNYAHVRALGQGSNQDALNCEVIEGMKFPLPPPMEQEAIAAAMDGVDAAMAVARDEAAGLRLLKESTADALLSGRVRV